MKVPHTVCFPDGRMEETTVDLPSNYFEEQELPPSPLDRTIALEAATNTILGSETTTNLRAAEQFRKAVQLFAKTLTEEQAIEVASVYPSWSPDTAYAVGDIVSYGVNSVGDPQLYKVVQAHTSQGIYPPGSGTESLYDAFGLDESGYPVWSQPSGSHDAYNKGDIVNYNGTLYISLIDGNAWSPEAYPDGWDVFEE